MSAVSVPQNFTFSHEKLLFKRESSLFGIFFPGAPVVLHSSAVYHFDRAFQRLVPTPHPKPPLLPGSFWKGCCGNMAARACWMGKVTLRWNPPFFCGKFIDFHGDFSSWIYQKVSRIINYSHIYIYNDIQNDNNPCKTLFLALSHTMVRCNDVIDSLHYIRFHDHDLGKGRSLYLRAI